MRASQTFRYFIVFAVGAISTSLAIAAEPVRFIPVFVQPYYTAGMTAKDRPQVSVARKYDQQLSSTDAKDILAVASSITQDNGTITPMTLMVLAVRMYDVGLRDESLFWFYAAKDRYLTLNSVLDLGHPSLRQVGQAVRDFANLAGPAINGYAFCDPPKQRAARERSIKWVEDNVYESLFLEEMPARAGDRQENLRMALKEIKELATKEAEFLARPETIAQLQSARKANGTADMYCW